jgi:hypothetical protein
MPLDPEPGIPAPWRRHRPERRRGFIHIPPEIRAEIEARELARRAADRVRAGPPAELADGQAAGDEQARVG